MTERFQDLKESLVIIQYTHEDLKSVISKVAMLANTIRPVRTWKDCRQLQAGKELGNTTTYEN